MIQKSLRFRLTKLILHIHYSFKLSLLKSKLSWHCTSCKVFFLISLLLTRPLTTENFWGVILCNYCYIIVVIRENPKPVSIEMSVLVSWPDFIWARCRFFYQGMFAVSVPCSISLLFFIAIIWSCCQAGSMFQPSSDFISDRWTDR